MTNPFDNPLGNPLGHLEDAVDRARRQRGTTAKPLPQIRGKRINDVLYVRADDVADALQSQAPEANKRLIDKLRGATR